jgi:hypothetical protein
MNKKILIGSIIALCILIGVSSTSALVVNNRPPDKPIITGPLKVKPGDYDWGFNAKDPEGDNVSYEIKWGDGTQEGWIGPFESNISIVFNHTYYDIGYVGIRARAKDVYGAIGNWSHIIVKIPKDKQTINLPLFRWLDRFPILNQLIMRFVEGRI